MFPWLVALAFLAFYLLLAAMFPAALIRCVETFEERPGRTILTGILWMIVCIPLSVLMLALFFMVVPTLVFFSALAAVKLFGKAAFLAWMGRRFLKRPAVGGAMAAVLIGGAILLVLYTIPVLGVLVWKVAGALGTGMVLYTLILRYRREAGGAGSVSTPAVSPSGMPSSPGPGLSPGPTPVSSFATDPSGLAASSPLPPPPLPPRLPAVLSSASAPRAGFWVRLAAALLDWVLIGLLVKTFHLKGLVVVIFAIYCVAMWAAKGTTIGGIICRLKVVRIDDRPMDSSIALVRALGAFLSAAVFFLGFIWVAVDDQAQSWHDRIAGTTIIRLPKGTPLI